jgi:hypothetical protein
MATASSFAGPAGQRRGPRPKGFTVAGWIILSAALGLIVLSRQTPAIAGYGAVAYDQEARKAGYAWDETTQKRANDAARRDCDSDDCEVRFGVPPKMCAAFATPESGSAWGGAVRKSLDDATFAATKNCQKHAKQKCVVRESKCTK